MQDNLESGRNTGKTTRVVDRIIQELFNKNVAYAYEYRNSSKAQLSEVFDRVTLRLTTEHPNTEFSSEHVVESGIACYKITLLKK